jgi:hypothetical protein
MNSAVFDIRKAKASSSLVLFRILRMGC